MIARSFLDTEKYKVFKLILGELSGSVTRWQDYSFNIWPFTTMKFWPIATNCQSISIIMSKFYTNSKNIALAFQYLQKWQNFATSGHTDPHTKVISSHVGLKLYT